MVLPKQRTLKSHDGNDPRQSASDRTTATGTPRQTPMGLTVLVMPGPNTSSVLGEPIRRHGRPPSRRHSLRSRPKACLSQAGLLAWLLPPALNPLMTVAHPTTARTPTAAPLILVPPSILVRRYTDGIFRPPR